MKIVIKIVIVIVIILGIAGTALYFVNQNNKKYSIEKIDSYEYHLLKQDNKFGVIDKNGNTLVKPNYTEIKIPNPQKPVFVCKDNEDTAVILNSKEEKILTQYDNIDTIRIEGTASNLPYEKTILKYEKDGKFGIINLEGKEITKPIYEEIKGLTNKESELLVKKDGKYGVINSKGAVIINNKYDNIIADGFYTEEAGYEFAGYIVSEKTQSGYRYGYFNYKHKKILDVEYADINRVVEISEKDDIYLLIVKNGQVGIMKNHDIIVECKYQDIEYHSANSTFILERNSKFGLADINGKVVIPVKYDAIEFYGDYINATISETTAVFNVEGKQIQDAVYNSITKVGEYYITVDKNGKYGVLASNRDIKVDSKYNYIEYLFENYFIVSKEDGDLGIISAEDKIIVDFEYDVIQKKENTNVIEAKKLNKNVTDLFSKDMKKIISKSNLTVNVKEDYIQTISDEIKYFNFEGVELTNKQAIPQNELYATKQDNKWGFVDKQNNVKIEYVYDMVTEFNEYGFAGIKQGDKWGIVNLKGEVVQEPIYKINSIPEVIGKYYKVYYGYGESYYTDNQEI